MSEVYGSPFGAILLAGGLSAVVVLISLNYTKLHSV